VRELNTLAERTIAADPADVWAYRLDFSNLPAYNADVTNLSLVEAAGTDGTGAHYRFDLAAGGTTTPIDLRVTEAVAGEVVAIEMEGALGARERFTVTPVPGGDDARGCVAAIALTLLVPDSIPTAADEGLLANGNAQIAGELDRMREILSPAGSLSTRGGNDGD
jgi:uncharacterized protein YndB with AHSA1/START domain